MDKSSVDASITAEWNRVQGRLREEFGDAAFKSWVAPMTVTDVRDGAVTLAVPTRFIRDWVLTHYADRIRALWNGENPEVRSVEVTVVTGMHRHDLDPSGGKSAAGTARAAAVESAAPAPRPPSTVRRPPASLKRLPPQVEASWPPLRRVR